MVHFSFLYTYTGRTKLLKPRPVQQKQLPEFFIQKEGLRKEAKYRSGTITLTRSLFLSSCLHQRGVRSSPRTHIYFCAHAAVTVINTAHRGGIARSGGDREAARKQESRDRVVEERVAAEHFICFPLHSSVQKK